jgi:sulfur carrier protein
METAVIDIQLNGRPERVPADTCISDLLLRLGLTGPGVAVAVNKEIVRRDAWPAARLAPGDQVEIIHAVGGG